MENTNTSIFAIDSEIKEAKEKYGPFNSTHEAAAVLREEFEEFWDVVKLPTRQKSDTLFDSYEKKKQKMIAELRQIAAVSMRTISELENDEIRWV